MLAIVAILTGSTGSRTASADVGVRVGPHGGVALDDEVDPYVGLGLWLSMPSSPLLIQPTFDYVFDEKQTLYRGGVSLLRELPLRSRFKPYFGLGVNLSVFALREQAPGPTPEPSFEPAPGPDDGGSRVGMNLLAGVRLELPLLSPYVQVTKGIGELDPLSIGGGIAVTLHEKGETRDAPVPVPMPMRFAATLYIDDNVLGDVQPGRPGLGLSLASHPWENLGFELDAEAHGHFFRDRDVAHLQPPGVDLNTNAALFSGSVVPRYCGTSSMFGTWCPYVTAGAGAIHSWFDGIARVPGATSFAKAQTDPALTAGVGLTHLFTSHVGLRVDARYFRALVDEEARDNGYSKDYGLLRLSAGVSVGFN